MVYNDHQPPHFHAKYGKYKITVEIESGIVDGRFPRRGLNTVLELYQIYKEELMENWELSLSHKELNKLPPLE